MIRRLIRRAIGIHDADDVINLMTYAHQAQAAINSLHQITDKNIIEKLLAVEQRVSDLEKVITQKPRKDEVYQ